MKKLLGVIGVLALVAALFPAQGFADLRGSFSLVTSGFPSPTGAEQGANRPGMNYTNPLDPGFTIHRWITFSSRSLIPGKEHVRTIFQLQNLDQAFARGFPLIALLTHPTADISYFDPAWSFDGKFLAYIQANADGSGQALYVQEYMLSTDATVASTTVGSPILVSATGEVRRPDWHPSSYTLAFDSNAAGTPDIYTVDVDVVMGTAGAPVRRTFDDAKAELSASWAPNGHDIAYSTNKFGPSVLEIIDLNLSSGDPAYTRLAETNFAFVSHNNPDFGTQGELYYDAPSNESAAQPSAVWKLDLASQAKCEIQLDQFADADPNVDINVNTPREGGNPYNHFLFTTQSGGPLNVWRGNPVNSCLAPLPLGVTLSPATINLSQGSSNQLLTAVFRLPPEAKDPNGDNIPDYQMQTTNTAAGEGMRHRASIFASPTLAGLTFPVILNGQPGTAECFNGQDTLSTSPLVTEPIITCFRSRRPVASRIVALGLTGQTVALEVTMYSNRSGRKFRGFGFIKVAGGGNAGSSVALLGNQPNPFNPATKIKFTVSKAGTYALRIYNVKGALVRTLANQHYNTGVHEAAWDGRTVTGGKAASGVYYAKISGASADDTDTIRLVMAK